MRSTLQFLRNTGDTRSALVTLGAAMVAALAVLVVAGSGSVKVIGAAMAGCMFLAGAIVSGNPRLFSLYGLMLAVPFDLSKRFGPIIAKMGGETSLRVEFSDVFLIVLLAYIVRDLATGRLGGLRIPKITYIWLVIAGFGVAAMLWGTYRLTAAHEVVRMLKVTLLFIVVCNELGTPQRLLHCAAGLSLGVLLQAMVGMYQYATRQHLGLDILGETGAGTTDQLAADSVRAEAVFRVGAFLNHPNIFGAYLAALLPMSLSVFLLKKGGPMKAMCMLAAALGSAALMASLSRSGWLSFAVACLVLVVLVLLHGRLRMKVLLPAGAAAMVLAVVLMAFSGPIINRIFESKPDAILGRAEYNRTAAGVIAAKPWLGHGLNSYVYVAPPYTRYGPRKAADVYENWLPPVHNIYLLWTAETGYIGLVVHLALLFSLLRVAIRNLKVRDETLFMINVACLCGVAALMVDGFFSFTLRINSVMRVFWVLAAMIMAIHYLHLREPRTASLASDTPRAA
ncbi:O-antigen ligase family protein [Comamonadaceae bacterium G21597-S1]|nr:O-antigen ligase family protein [Comamonadaceae bacterium G21597-S1]